MSALFLALFLENVELENNILAWREMGHVRMGTDHVMWTLDDSAMAWRHMTVYNETKSVCMM